MTLRNYKILIVDDEKAIRRFLTVVLQAEGADVYHASTAKQGVEQCIKACPDITILDLGLPDKDGLEILPQLKSYSSSQKKHKILVLSVRKDTETIRSAYAQGADAYMSKPFTVDDLFDTIDEKLS